MSIILQSGKFDHLKEDAINKVVQDTSQEAFIVLNFVIARTLAGIYVVMEFMVVFSIYLTGVLKYGLLRMIFYNSDLCFMLNKYMV